MHLSPKIISLVCLIALVAGFSLFYAVPGASACSRMLFCNEESTSPMSLCVMSTSMLVRI